MIGHNTIYPLFIINSTLSITFTLQVGSLLSRNFGIEESPGNK